MCTGAIQTLQVSARFDLMIGADGLHSDVRSLAFGPQHQFEKQLGYVVAAFEVCRLSSAR